MERLTQEELGKVFSYFLHEEQQKRWKSFSAFQQLYEDVISSESAIEIDPKKCTSHREIREAAEQLQRNQYWTRKEFVEHAFPNYVHQGARKRDPAVMIVQLMCMLDCDAKDRYSRNRIIGNWQPTRWEHSQTFRDFVKETIPAIGTPMRPFQHDLSKLTAWKLQNQYGIQLIATNNIAEHLLYDSADGGTLRIFHQVSWLTAQARYMRSADDGDNTGVESKDRKLLPQQIVEETLDTFYKILFPLHGQNRKRSIDLLHELAKGGVFDQNAISPSILPPEGLQYCYWADRITSLTEVVNRLERRKGDRTMLLIAIIGIFLSAFFGMLSLIIGALQLWTARIALNIPAVSCPACPHG